MTPEIAATIAASPFAALGLTAPLVRAIVDEGYPKPTPGYEQLVDTVAFYPGSMDECTVDGERVSAQAGDFYGGWITHDVVGPFKGSPGTLRW